MTDLSFDRRDLFRASGLLTVAAVAGATVDADAATKAVLDTGDPRAMMMILARLQGDVAGKLTYGYQRGRVFGLIGGAGLPLDQYGRRLYDYEGASVGRSRILGNGDVETKSRSWLFYTDPATGAYIKKWVNPYTGEAIDVPPFRGGISGGTITPNGPKVSANFTMESTVFNKPTQLEFVTIGERTWVSREAFTRWTPKGSTQARTEFTLDTWVAATRDLMNPKLTAIPSASSWTSQTEWQTWLKMPATQAGQQLWKSDGMKVYRIADLPPAFVDHANKEHPGILTDAITFEG
jgi:Protein of unknown function (DUF1838)